MKRLVFFIIGLIFFLWLLVSAVRFIMNTDFYKHISSISSPLSSQTQKDSINNKQPRSPEFQNNKKEKIQNDLFFEKNEFTAGVRGQKGARLLLEKFLKKSGNNLFSPISAMENALSFSVDDALKNSKNPKKTMEDILQNMQNVRAEGKKSLAALTDKSTQLQQEVSDDESRLSALEKEYFAALNAEDKKKSDALFDEYVALKKSLVEKKARLGKQQTLAKKTSGLLNKLDARITALQANEKALLCGISPDDLTDAAKIKAQKAISSSSSSLYISEFTVGAPHMGRSGYILGESTPVPLAANLTVSGDTENISLPKNNPDLRIPQLYENGWNTFGMRGIYPSQAEYLNYLLDDSQL